MASLFFLSLSLFEETHKVLKLLAKRTLNPESPVGVDRVESRTELGRVLLGCDANVF